MQRGHHGYPAILGKQPSGRQVVPNIVELAIHTLVPEFLPVLWVLYCCSLFFSSGYYFDFMILKLDQRSHEKPDTHNSIDDNGAVHEFTLQFRIHISHKN